MISKDELKKLAELARIEIPPEEEEKLRSDLGAILDYFTELQHADTEGVKPMTGGTHATNVLRDDVSTETALQNEGALEAFPENQGGLLKVPPVFE
jgi:aspartyl-tRNA(Asn)/glutamyl-tRNA(Gln) amidotransferase subunit C